MTSIKLTQLTQLPATTLPAFPVLSASPLLMVLMLSATLLQTACTTTAYSDSPIPVGGPTMVEIYRDATRHGQQSQAGPLPASITPVSASQSNCQDLSAYDEGDEYSDIDEGYVFKETIAADQKPLCGPVFSANAAHQPPAAPATKATTDITTDKTSVPTGSESTVTATTEKPTNKPVAQSLYAPYTRTQINELESLFPRLPNPDIAIYMYPHLSTRNEVPVPGYTTVIPLYERVQYALPGEPQAVKK